MELYLEPEPQSWYYFKYANNLLLTKSQSEGFDAEVGGKAKGDYQTATSYGAFLADFTDVDAFRSHFLKDFLGKSGKLAARPVAPEPTGNFDVFEDKKKKKKNKGDDAFGSTDAPANPDATEAAPEPAKKKKKLKANDPFSDGVLDDPAPVPAPAKKEKARDKAADTPVPTTAPAKKETVKENPADAPPAADAAPDPAQARKEADRQAKEAEKLRKEEEKKKKEEEKKKKKATDDPFGDS